MDEKTPEGETSQTTLADLLSSNLAPVQRSILSQLNPADITNLFETSKAFESMMTTLELTDYNINMRLQKFFKHPDEFRGLQGKISAVIGGNFAYDFFARRLQSDNELEIYYEDKWLDGAPVGDRNVQSMFDYMQENGYKLVTRETLKSAIHKLKVNDNCWMTITKFEKKWGNETMVVKFIADQWAPPVLQVLCYGRVTARMNFIAWNKAYSLFPQLTFIKKVLYLTAPLQGKADRYANGDEVNVDADLLRALSIRGLKTKSVNWMRQRAKFTEQVSWNDEQLPSDRLRRVGDNETWVIALDTTAVANPAIPDGVIESASFSFQGKGNHYEMEFPFVIESSVLRHRYFIVGWFGMANLHTGLPSYLADSLYMEIIKLSEDKRPSGFESFLRNYRSLDWGPVDERWTKETFGRAGEWQFPDTWQFYDDDVIEFLRKKSDEFNASQEKKKREDGPDKPSEETP